MKDYQTSIAIVYTILTFTTLLLFSVCVGLILTSCTYSINMVHTQGEAKDVVDETQAAEPNISPNLNVPTL